MPLHFSITKVTFIVKQKKTKLCNICTQLKHFSVYPLFFQDQQVPKSIAHINWPARQSRNKSTYKIL